MTEHDDGGLRQPERVAALHRQIVDLKRQMACAALADLREHWTPLLSAHRQLIGIGFGAVDSGDGGRIWLGKGEPTLIAGSLEDPASLRLIRDGELVDADRWTWDVFDEAEALARDQRITEALHGLAGHHFDCVILRDGAIVWDKLARVRAGSDHPAFSALHSFLVYGPQNWCVRQAERGHAGGDPDRLFYMTSGICMPGQKVFSISALERNAAVDRPIVFSDDEPGPPAR